MRYYMNSDCGCTGESFKDLAELHVWYMEVTGEYPSYNVKKAMRNGQSFQVGSRFYTVEKKAIPEVAVA